jgi:hypothetical protein
MPIQISTWDCLTWRSNQSKSIANVIQHEAKFQVKRAISRNEIVNITYAKDTFKQTKGLTTMMKNQYTMTGISDGKAKFKINHLAGQVTPKFVLQTKVQGTNKVLDQQDGPDQIHLGSYDTHIFLLGALAIYLKAWMEDCR